MFDIAGQALGVPAYRLLGSKVRDTFPVAYWSPHQSPEITRQHAQEAAELGCKVHKIKARPDDGVEQVEAMAQGGGPDLAIRLDPNCHFDTLAQTVRIDRALESYNIESFEDPFPKERMALYRLAREKCRIPIALHSAALPLIMDAMRLDAIDYLNTGGSPEHVRKGAALAEANGIPIWIAFEGHCLDVVAAFAAHVGAVLPNFTLPADCLPFLRERGITREGLPVADGEIPVPQGPGLGVTLDQDLVAEYRIE
jgi:L-alanine-DL-glutamate epimerase-like enolase superfamily enzyme